MIREQWRKVRDEWRANRRLRLAGLVALVFLVLHAVSVLEDRRQNLARQYGNDLELQARLEGMRGQKDWDTRAIQAEAALEDMRNRVPDVSGGGLAQAELQNWLTELGAKTALSEARVRVEQTMDVPGYPDMWQVMGRLDGQIPQYGNAAFLRAVSEGLPWIQAENLEIGEGTPARMSLVVRAYYRRAAEGPAAVAAPQGADTPDSAPAPATPAAGESR